MTYAVVSDIHAHAWSTFSGVDSDGVNSRLRIILNELERAAQALKSAGGSTMVIAGDIFHVRGSIDPEVLNPTQRAFERVMDLGVTIYAIPGNHDLKSKETTELGSAIQTLSNTYSDYGGFQVLHEPEVITTIFGERLGFVPWCSSTTDLLDKIEQLTKRCVPDATDLFIHAGIDGVLSNMPASGLTHSVLGDFGFRRVFAGHYHHHKDFGNGVLSVGATTHHNWGDVGTKAGFLLVDGSGQVKFNDTHAPKFVDVTGLDEVEMELACDGNYVRFRGPAMTLAQIKELREFFTKSGARGTSIEAPKSTVSARPTAVAATGQSLDTSVSNYIKSRTDWPAHLRVEDIEKRAAEILTETRSVFADA